MRSWVVAFILLFCNALPSFSQTNGTTVISGLQSPVTFEQCYDGRLFITLKGTNSQTPQNAKVVVYDSSGSFINTFIDLSNITTSVAEMGVLGIALDPDFASNNFVYVFHTYKNGSTKSIHVNRYTDSNSTATQPLLILEIPLPASLNGNHLGGNIHFKSSEPGKLYISIGELNVPSNAQLLSNPFGKILRINKDGSIPADNPYFDDENPSTNNDDRIWTYGHRNPFDFTFSSSNDSLYITENGEYSFDELNYGIKGNNYGWNSCEGNVIFNTTNPCIDPGFTNPIYTWASPVPALTGICYFDSDSIPGIKNHLMVGSYSNGKVYALELGNAPFYDTIISSSIFTTLSGITSIKQGIDGCLYILQGGFTNNGALKKFCGNQINSTEQLSKTGSLGLYPNPIQQGNTVLNFKLNNSSLVSLKVYSTHGQLLKENNLGYLNHGPQTINADFTGLPQGVYFILISGNSEISNTLKLVIAQ
jgi:glucose/arabinose dehydrogenase